MVLINKSNIYEEGYLDSVDQINLHCLLTLNVRFSEHVSWFISVFI